ncbi:MAG: hypothetical protein DMG07_10650, partial [Acidobacteria bacterium]
MLQRFTRSVLVVALLVPGSFIVQGLLPGSSAWASPRVAAPDPAAPVPAPPSLTSINPASATVGAAQFTLTLTGTGFLAAAVASFGVTPLTTSFIDATSLTAVVPASLLLTAGTPDVTVDNQDAQGPSNAQTFTINNPAPTLTSIAPTSTIVGTPAVTLTLTGTNFVSTSTAQWNGSPLATGFGSSTLLVALVPGSLLTTQGTADVTVVNPTPGGGTSGTQVFSINNPPPAVSGISPSSAAAGSGAFILTVNGANFINGGSTVRWAGSDRTTSFVNSTQLTAQILASDVALGGTFTVTVFNSGGGGESNGFPFAVNNPSPSVTLLSPASVLVGSAQFTITVTGTNFVSTSGVLWNGTGARTTFFDSSSQVRAVIPASDLTTIGTFLVFVSNPGPGGGTASQSFNVENPIPSLSSISPQTTFTGGSAFVLTVNGTNFNSSTFVQFAGTSQPTTFVNASQVTASIPAAAIASAGSKTVTVVNPAPGGGNASTTFQVDNPTPVISTLAPASATAGGPAFTLTINGSSFVSGASVLWNGSARTTTFVSSTVLTVAIPASDIATGTTVGVTVVNPPPGGGSTTASFNSNSPTPTISSLSPASTLVGGSQFTLTVNGTNFVSNSVVRWNGSDRTTTFVSSTVLTAVIPASDITVIGTNTVIVFNPAPAGGIATRSFDVDNPIPSISSLNPATVVIPASAPELTINGTNFVAGTTVSFGGSSRTVAFDSSVRLRVTLLASDVTTAGTFQITVTNASPGGGSASSSLTVENPVPTISSFSPATGSAGTGAFTLTVNGSNFVSTSAAQFGGSSRTVTFISSTQLGVALTAADNALGGAFTILVQNPTPGGGLATATYTINYLAPTITSFNPVNPVALGPAFTLTVNGTNFYSTSVVRWAGGDRPTTFLSATQLAAAITAADIALSGTFAVSVFNPTPGGGTASLNITVNNPVPTITSLNPASVTVLTPSFTLTVNGTNFVAASGVRWNGSARATTFVSNTRLTAIISAADILTAGTSQVTVFNPAPGGGTSNAVTFTMNNPKPSLTSINPSALPAGFPADFTLLVTGQDFVKTSVVRWKGAAKTTTYISGTQLSATIPSADRATAGTLDVTVFNPTPGGGESAPQTFTSANPEPHVLAFSPASTPAGGGDLDLTIYGVNFVPTSVVRWVGSDRVTFFNGGNSIIGRIKAADIATTGSFQVTVFSPAPGGGSAGGEFQVVNGAPTLTSLSPNSAGSGGAAFTLTVTGTKFVSGSVVTWNGDARATTYVSSTSLNASIPASDLTTPGTAQVAVFNPPPAGGVSNTLSFGIGNPAPTLTSLQPATAPAGGPAFTLTLNGTGFVSTSVGTFNSANRTTAFVSSTQLTMALTASDIATPGTGKVAVVNPAPGGGTSNTLDLPIPYGVPVLTSLAPSKVNAGSADF